ncbi:MAG: NAD(P)-binding domain-containing protein [Chitinispirillaceae bacterium]|nr:NAD(P)-binding domain-containing protein [Chitinispirillaceae bacterium]
MSKKVGILGSGMVAQALAAGFLKNGFSVTLGSRDPAKLSDFVEKVGNRLSTGSLSDAAAFGDLLVLAIKGKNAKEALALAGHHHLKGKTVIDTTNPIDDAPPDNGVLKFFSSLERSLMEELQAAVPDAHFVKGFSMIGAAHMVDPDFGGTRPTMFICGNSDAAKAEAFGIITTFGFDVEDLGGAEAARAIEPLCILWCIPGFRSNEWNHALKLLKK